jgi:UDP-4-amino-4-deoxy-L-arabinose-oxoglutarate aminotransferase
MAEPSAAALLPFSRPSIDEATIQAVGEVLRSGWITSGKHVLAFEQAFAELSGAPFAVALSSGTAGLDLAVAALALKPGDEVIVPSINWVSGPNMIEIHGGRAVFCEVDEQTLNLDVQHAASLVTARTRALMPVHFTGAPCALAEVLALAGKYGLAVIEDAAHATGARYQGAPIGSQARGPLDCAVFSFHPSKNITTGEGGMITCHDVALADRLRLSRFHGIRKDAWKNHARSGRDRYEVEYPGRKYNLTDLQAVIGVHQLKRLDWFHGERARLAARYRQRLPANGLAQPLDLPAHPDSVHAWHIYVVLLNGERFALQRAQVVAQLEQRGIGTALHFPPVHRQQHYAARNPMGSLPVSERVGERLLSLPLFPGMSEADVDRVVDALIAIGEAARR